MSELTIKIGRYDANARAVDVTFTSGDIVHRRSVNAVLTPSGAYDKKGTATRVEEVGRGVAAKIGLGVITAPVIEEEAPADE